MVNFLQKSRASASDDNEQEGQLEYCGVIQDIFKLQFRRFDYFLFDVKWFRVVTAGRNATVRRDKSGLLQVDSTKLWTDARDTFVLPEHCERVVFTPDPKEPQWLFVLQVAPRSRQICEDVDVEEVPSSVDSEMHAVEEEEEIIVREEKEFEEEQVHEEVTPDMLYEDDDREETAIPRDLEVANVEIDMLSASDLQEDARIGEL